MSEGASRGPLVPGQKLGPYELLSILAQGGMGTVWLARPANEPRKLVALKTILPMHSENTRFRDMFLDEARIASRIDHPNVAKIFHTGDDHGVLFYAMEFVQGESLRKLQRQVATGGIPFPLGVALRVCADACSGLHAAHELRNSEGTLLDVVHRDISPHNILVTMGGDVKLIDFGVAKAKDRLSKETTTGAFKGKLEFMAPEQARGDKIDRRADIYAMGAILYQLASGRSVYDVSEGKHLAALHALMMGHPYEPLPPSVPPTVRALIEKALSQSPSDRHPTAQELREDIEAAMSELGRETTIRDVATVMTNCFGEKSERLSERISLSLEVAGGRTEIVDMLLTPFESASGVSGMRSKSGGGTLAFGSVLPSEPKSNNRIALGAALLGMLVGTLALFAFRSVKHESPRDLPDRPPIAASAPLPPPAALAPEEAPSEPPAETKAPEKPAEPIKAPPPKVKEEKPAPKEAPSAAPVEPKARPKAKPKKEDDYGF